MIAWLKPCFSATKELSPQAEGQMDYDNFREGHRASGTLSPSSVWPCRSAGSDSSLAAGGRPGHYWPLALAGFTASVIVITGSSSVVSVRHCCCC